MKTRFKSVVDFLKDFSLWILLVLFGRNIKLAKSWNELSEKQLQEISFAVERYHRFINCHPIDTRAHHFSRLYVRLVKNLLRTNNFVKTWIALKQIPPEEYEENVEFLLQEVTRTNFLPAFKLNGSEYHPPLSRLQNITIKEFSFLDSMYYRWRKTKDDRFLDLLCAALYRRGSYKHFLSSRAHNELDIRKPFNKILIEQEVSNFKKVCMKKKLAIAYTYEGCRNYIVKLYPHTFPKPKKKDPEDKDQEKEAVYTPFGQLLLYKIQFDTSKLESTQNLNAYEFLNIFENELKESKNQK